MKGAAYVSNKEEIPIHMRPELRDLLGGVRDSGEKAGKTISAGGSINSLKSGGEG